MSKTDWNPPPAKTREELQNTLCFAASGLKNQVLGSPVLADPALSALKERISEIADELHGLQQEANPISLRDFQP